MAIREPRSRPGWIVLGVLAAIAGPFLLLDLDAYGIVGGDEAYYHWVARNMVETGAWGRIEFVGETRMYDAFTHAPLFFWAKALVLLVLEDGRFAMRILSALFGVVSVLTTAWLGRRLAGDGAGLLAGLIQLTSFQFVYLHGARTGVMEPVLLTLLTATVILFIRSIEEKRSFLLHHLCLVAIVNLKLGLVVAPLLGEAAYLLATPSARHRLRDWLGLGLLAAPIGTAWHVVQASLHWDTFVETVVAVSRQTAGTGRQASPVGVLGNLDYYASVMAWGSFPHSLLYPFALLCLWKAPAPGPQRLRIVLLQGAALLVFFAVVSSHYSWYVMPLVPLFSALVAAWLVRLGSRPPALWMLVALGLAIGFGAASGAWWLDPNPFADKVSRMRSPLWGKLVPNDLGAVPGWAVASLSAAAAVASLVALRRRPAVIAAGVSALLLASAAVRVVVPLRFRHHVSRTEQIHQYLEARRRDGLPIAYPIALLECDRWRTRYFFGESWALETVSPRPPRGKPCAWIVGPQGGSGPP